MANRRQIGRRDMTPFTKPFALLLGVAQWFFFEIYLELPKLSFPANRS
jgi:hypothetical protein